MNILFVFSDQQRYTALGANGNKVVQTPNLDQMASEGMVCDNMVFEPSFVYAISRDSSHGTLRLEKRRYLQ